MTPLYSPLNPPHKALSGQDKHSFGYTTLQSRLPVIVSKIVDDVYRAYNGLSDSDPLKKEKEQEAKKIIELIGGLRYELQRDKPFRPFTDSREDVEEWNQALAEYYPTSSWYKASWLFSECYLYRRVKEAFALTQHWKDYDPFFEQKQTVFKSSQKAVVSMAVQLTTPVDPKTKKSMLDIKVQDGPESKGTRDAFFEMVQVSLWGNATDLSLLDNPDLAKIEELQRRMLSSGSSNNSSANASPAASTVHVDQVAQDSPEEHASELEKHADKILSNDSELLWSKVKSLRNGRVDIILDNAGFELFVDFVFADYLVRAGFASEVVFHAKRIPWFVSDVMPFDFQWTLDQLHRPTSSTSDNTPPTNFFNPTDPIEQQALQDVGKKWQDYVNNGIWKVTSHEFWTSCYSFYHLPTHPSAQDLFQDMRQSDLWIFKGDLNYRKLVYDCKWPTTTPFTKAIGPLGDGENKAEGVPVVVSFRTCKADVVVGLAEGVEEKMDKVVDNWMVNGEYAVISVSP
ncbi:hypothetical protein BG015_007998 [Linnemannia schmuckeri]|uniref:Sugar phosphate phosphatase n=1 Tax=Linnemannia schmuckeri TaxID=64567 RepID=A0A9P5S053_9FUNG|nr:hypothetical protein BG015_007998 [Linnemannia schmuckeri]